MPSPKTPGRDDAPATGFEALDVKAEALEAQAAVSEIAALEVEAAQQLDGAPEVTEAPPEPAPSAELFTFTPPARPAGVETLLTSALRCGQSAMQLQVEALSALGRARGPQDVIALQMDFSRKLLGVYAAETKSAAASLSRLFTGRAAGPA